MLSSSLKGNQHMLLIRSAFPYQSLSRPKRLLHREHSWPDILVMKADQVTQTIWSGDNGRNNSCLCLATNKSTVIFLCGLRGIETFLNCVIKDKRQHSIFISASAGFALSPCRTRNWEQNQDDLSPFPVFLSVPSSPNGMNFATKLHNKKSNSCITGEPCLLLIKSPSV